MDYKCILIIVSYSVLASLPVCTVLQNLYCTSVKVPTVYIFFCKILYRMLFTGLLGDATEEFVENLDTQQGQLNVTLYGYVLHTYGVKKFMVVNVLEQAIVSLLAVFVL